LGPSADGPATSAAEVNEIVSQRADRGGLEGILLYSEQPLVSSGRFGALPAGRGRPYEGARAGARVGRCLPNRDGAMGL